MSQSNINVTNYQDKLEDIQSHLIKDIRNLCMNKKYVQVDNVCVCVCILKLHLVMLEFLMYNGSLLKIFIAE